jgi:Amt family ammonium transporter
VIGSGVVCLTTLVVAFIVMYAVNATGTLRVSREGDLEGLDSHPSHGVVPQDLAPAARIPSPSFSSIARPVRADRRPFGTVGTAL